MSLPDKISVQATMSVISTGLQKSAAVASVKEVTCYIKAEQQLIGLPCLVGKRGASGSSAWGEITGTLSDQDDLQDALDLKAPLASPALTGTPTAPTPTSGDDSTKIATTEFVNDAYTAGDGIVKTGTEFSADLQSSGYPAQLGSTASRGTATTVSRSDHVHRIPSLGSINPAGGINAKVNIASYDRLVITDYSDDNCLKSTNISFDGNTATKALTQKGTWESFAAASHNHDDRYYTEAETDDLLAAKADTADLGALASRDTVDYTTDITNTPTLGDMAGVNDAPSNGNEYVRKNGAWAVASGGGGGGSVSWGSISGTLSNQTDLNTALGNKANTADLGDLASLDTLDYSSNKLTNKPTLGNLAAKNSVDYTTDISNTPTLGTLASQNSVDWDTDITDIPSTFPPSVHNHDDRYYTETETDSLLSAKANTADLGDLAMQDTVDYATDVTNKPTLGTMAAVNDAASDGNEYVRKNGTWAVASGGGGGGGTWGSITGTLSDQTDLQNALAAKADTADLGDLASQDTVDYTTDITNLPTLGTMAAVNDASSDSKIYGRKNGAWAKTLIQRIESGNTGSLTLSGTSYTTKNVTFSPAFPDANYLIFLSMNCNDTVSAFGQVSYSFHSKTASGFSIKIYNASSGQRTGFNIAWVAMSLT